MTATPWATPADAIASSWRDASDVPPAVLEDCLEAAQEECEIYAPAPKIDPATLEPIVPIRYRLAVILQAREVWTSARRNGDVIAGDTYVIRARPLTAAVRQLLRPKRGRPGVG